MDNFNLLIVLVIIHFRYSEIFRALLVVVAVVVIVFIYTQRLI